MQRASILIVEDNQDMRNAVSGYLKDAGYKVDAAESAETAINKRLFQDKDIALLDISPPGMSGLELTSELKNLGYEGPIIAITARDTVDDKIIGLETGMVDYLVKPFDLRELDARISAHLKLSGAQHDLANIKTKHYRIEPKKHAFYIDESVIKLTLVEFRLMLKLMLLNRTVANSQDLIEAAWGEEAALSNPPLRIHISNLRNKIGDSDYSIIQTVPGVGYMLVD